MKKFIGAILTLCILCMVSSLSPTYAASIKVTDVKSTMVKSILNASGLSGVQQFSYKNEGIAYGYMQSGFLNIVLPDGNTFTDKTQYPLLGDITADNDGNVYVVWGRENKTNNKSVETVFISKYSPDGKLVKTTGFVGETMEGGGDGGSGNTKAFSSSGSCVSAIHGDTLIVHYARAMYNGHQSSNTIGVKISDMSPISGLGREYYTYVSHSFDQSVIWSEKANSFLFADQGDAGPRGFVIGGYKNRFVPFHFYLQANANYNMQVVNRTFAQLGGLVETSKGVALVGASAKSISEKAKIEKQNLFVQVFDPTIIKGSTDYYADLGSDAFIGGIARTGATSDNVNDNDNTPLVDVTDHGVQWLTDYTDTSATSPRAVVIDDKIVILYWNKSGSCYMVLDASGEIIVPETSMGEVPLNSYETPIAFGDRIYWATVKSGTLQVYSLNPTTGEYTKPTAAEPVKPVEPPKPTEPAKPTNPLASRITITKQPAPLITLTKGKISGNINERIFMEASTTSGTLTYRLGKAKSANTTAGASIDPYTRSEASFKLSPTLPIGTYYYFFYIYLDGELATTSEIATVQVVRANIEEEFLEMLPYDRIESGSLNSYQKIQGKPTVVVFGGNFSCAYPGIYAGYKFIKDNLLEGKVNLLAFCYAMNEEDVKKKDTFVADWFSLYSSGDEQMWALLKENGVNYPLIAYFDGNGKFIRYRMSREALNNVKTDFEEMLGKSGVVIPPPKPPISSLVTINKQPAPITMVTEGKITERISIDATTSSGKLTYSWGIAKTDNKPPTGTILQVATPEFKLGSLKAGTYYYFCVLYLDGKEAVRSDIATVQVVKAEETSVTNPETINPETANPGTTNMKKGINVMSYPTKTQYTIGEGFDTSGAKVVFNTGAKLNDVTANILFYTSKTVQLTQGRPFTTTGTKKIELRQHDGKVIGTYTITVAEKSSTATETQPKLKEGVNILSYPKRTEYTIGEGFDPAGLKAVNYTGGEQTSINSKITFYTSRTVQLTKGRKFTTTGKKDVEIRYNGKKVATYTVYVKAKKK